MREDERLTNLMTSRMKEMLIPLLDSNGIIEVSQFVRVREGRFIWKAQLSSPSLPSKKILVKAIASHKDNIFEIILYEKNPTSLRDFFPKIYHVGKKYGFYWLMMEELKPLPAPKLCESDFGERIQLMASLHAKNYNEDVTLTNKEIDWVPHFQKQWNKRMNRLWLMLQMRKYMRNPKTSKILAKDYSFLKKVIYTSPVMLKPLLNFPHTVIHGCLTPHHFLSSLDNSQLKLVDWATICFAPFTIDLVDLIERGIREYAQEESQISDFRENCISFYFECLSKQGIDINRDNLKKWYEITLLFKIVGEIIWKELKKISNGETSKYYWYRNRLSNFSDFPLGARK